MSPDDYAAAERAPADVEQLARDAFAKKHPILDVDDYGDLFCEGYAAGFAASVAKRKATCALCCEDGLVSEMRWGLIPGDGSGSPAQTAWRHNRCPGWYKPEPKALTEERVLEICGGMCDAESAMRVRLEDRVRELERRVRP